MTDGVRSAAPFAVMTVSDAFKCNPGDSPPLGFTARGFNVFQTQLGGAREDADVPAAADEADADGAASACGGTPDDADGDALDEAASGRAADVDGEGEARGSAAEAWLGERDAELPEGEVGERTAAQQACARHHCRACGRVVCDGCSKRQQCLPRACGRTGECQHQAQPQRPCCPRPCCPRPC